MPLDGATIAMQSLRDVGHRSRGVFYRPKKCQPSFGHEFHHISRVFKADNALIRQQLASIRSPSHLTPSFEKIFFRSGLDREVGHLLFLREIQSCSNRSSISSK